MRLNSGSPLRRRGRIPLKINSRRYCFDAVQRPTHPSDRLNVPAPLRPETWPELMTVMPSELPTELVAPLGLTLPLRPSPMILLLLTTTAVVLLPEQVVPPETTTTAPSKLPPPPPPPAPPPLRREVDRRGSSASRFLRPAFPSGSTDRHPDSAFSSLPSPPP